MTSGARYTLSDGPSSSSGGKAIQSWNPRVRPGSPAPPPCQTPPPALHPFETAAWQQTLRSVRVFIADAPLRNVGKGCDAGMRMESEASEGFSVIVEEVKEYE